MIIILKYKYLIKCIYFLTNFKEEWPTTWRPMGSKTCHLFELSEECFEYEDILNSFKNTMPEDTCIVKVSYESTG